VIRVLIVDDQRLMRDGLRTLLNLEPDLEVVATAQDGNEGVQLAQDYDIDVVLLDIRMPNLDGISALKQIHAAKPEARILMLTTYDDEEDVVSALSSGASGYLLKDMPGEEIASAIRTTRAGGAVLPPRIAQTFLAALQNDPQKQPLLSKKSDPHENSDAIDATVPNTLTEREREVLQCLAKGMSNKEMADTLFVTEGTVKNHVSSLIAKLGLRDRTQVALHAVRCGYGE